MDRIWPAPPAAVERAVDAVAAVVDEKRVAPPGRPWVALNMIASVDGASADTEGRSGALGGPADHQVFHALRAAADVILAGAGTVRAENYGTPKVAPQLQDLRRERGQAPLPRLAVLSASLRLDPGARLFREAPAGQSPVVLTSEAALATEPSATAGRRLAEVADVHAVGRDLVDWDEVMRVLHDDLGTRILLVEGGPNVNGQLVAHDLVDELCLTLSPVLLGGLTARIVADTAAMTPRPLTLGRVFVDDEFLLLRYIRRHDDK